MTETLGDVLPPEGRERAVVSLEHNQSIGDAMKILAKNSILSAPVVISPDLEDLSELRAEQPRPQLLGWLDVNDIVREFVKSVGEKLEGKNMLHLMSVLEQEGPAFAERPLVTLMGGEDKQLVYDGERSMPLKSAIDRYFLGSGDLPPVHRIALFDAGGTIDAVISQMDVLKYMHGHHATAAWAQQTVEDAGFVTEESHVAAVDINTPTVHALSLLVRGGRSAVAVLAPDGGLVTNLSTSDLRYLQPNHFGVLALPVGEFLGLLHGAVYVGSCALDGDLRRSTSSGGSPSPSAAATDDSGGRHKAAPEPAPSHQFFAQGAGSNSSVPLITCGRGTPVSLAIDMMLEKRVHRVYIVDDSADAAAAAAAGGTSGKPLAVVTTTDLIAFISKNLADAPPQQ
eukprot:jgi/Ulvmu1/10774/UM069_0008.1